LLELHDESDGRIEFFPKPPPPTAAEVRELQEEPVVYLTEYDLSQESEWERLTQSFLRNLPVPRPKRDPLAPRYQYPPEEVRVGRNDPCPCGSGAKFKKCCGR
jgi:hypothetical protein